MGSNWCDRYMIYSEAFLLGIGVLAGMMICIVLFLFVFIMQR